MPRQVGWPAFRPLAAPARETGEAGFRSMAPVGGLFCMLPMPLRSDCGCWQCRPASRNRQPISGFWQQCRGRAFRPWRRRPGAVRPRSSRPARANSRPGWTGLCQGCRRRRPGFWRSFAAGRFALAEPGCSRPRGWRQPNCSWRQWDRCWPIGRVRKPTTWQSPPALWRTPF